MADTFPAPDAPASTDALPSHGAATSPSLWLRLWPVYVIIGGLLAAWAFGLLDFISIETLRAQRETLTGFVAAHPVLAIAIYLVIYAAATVFMLPGALWITIAGGLLFGLAGGTAATVAGATLGASTLFFAARTSFGGLLREKAGSFVRKMEAGFNEDALSWMFAMRLMPVVPFPVANIAPALLGAKYWQYALTTAVGIIPGVLAYTWIGASLGATFDAGETENLLDAVANFIPAFIALGIVALIPIAWKRFAGRKASKLEGLSS